MLHEAVGIVWARGEANEPFDNEALARRRLGLVTAVKLAAQAIDLLHDAAGMNAIMQDRCSTVAGATSTRCRNTLLSPPRFEIGGRVLLGLEPGGPVI